MTQAKKIPPNVVQGDITALNVAAVVNAANNQLANGSGVNGAIHRAAGPLLPAACAALGGCATGEAKATPGFDLPARYIFHAVGPVWRGGQNGEDHVLASCYQCCMALAQEYEVESIAFPALSCGIFGFPMERAIPIAISEVDKVWQGNPKLQEVIFCCFDENAARQYRNALNIFYRQ